MKITDWARREDLQLEWKQLWETNQALKAGFAVLRDIAWPTQMQVPTGTDSVQFNALMNARREGYFDALRNIEALKEIKRQNQPLPEPWSDAKKED
jgi:hypothetical protein